MHPENPQTQGEHAKLHTESHNVRCVFEFSHQWDLEQIQDSGHSDGEAGARVPDDQRDAGGRTRPGSVPLQGSRDDRQGGPGGQCHHPAGIVDPVTQRDVGQELRVSVNLVYKEDHRLRPAQSSEIQPKPKQEQP